MGTGNANGTLSPDQALLFGKLFSIEHSLCMLHGCVVEAAQTKITPMLCSAASAAPKRVAPVEITTYSWPTKNSILGLDPERLRVQLKTQYGSFLQRMDAYNSCNLLPAGFDPVDAAAGLLHQMLQRVEHALRTDPSLICHSNIGIVREADKVVHECVRSAILLGQVFDMRDATNAAVSLALTNVTRRSKVSLPNDSIKARIAGPYLKEEIQHNSSKPNTDHATFAFVPSYRGQPAYHPMQYVWTNAAATTNQAAYATFTWQQDDHGILTPSQLKLPTAHAYGSQTARHAALQAIEAWNSPDSAAQPLLHHSKASESISTPKSGSTLQQWQSFRTLTFSDALANFKQRRT